MGFALLHAVICHGAWQSQVQARGWLHAAPVLSRSHDMSGEGRGTKRGTRLPQRAKSMCRSGLQPPEAILCRDKRTLPWGHKLCDAAWLASVSRTDPAFFCQHGHSS